MQSHPSLPLQERSRLCRCLNFEKLSLEACKDLAKNPRIPPRISVQALASQHKSNSTQKTDEYEYISPSPRRKSKKIVDSTTDKNRLQMVLYKDCNNSNNDSFRYDKSCEENLLPEELKLNLEGMQWRVVELEKVCREMKGHIARINKVAPHYNRPLPRLC